MTLTTQADILATQPAEAQLQALLHHAGNFSLNDLGWIRITGEDRVRWLNGMVTNSIQDLAPGLGCFNFILNAQGRIQGTAYAFARPDDILLQTSRAHLAGLIATLDRFIIMDDVELTGDTTDRTGIGIAGPEAASFLKQLGLPTPSSLALETISWHGAEVTLLATHSPLVPRFELWANAATAESLTLALATAGAEPCAPEVVEWLRLLEGTPRYGTDIRDKELPQETAQTQALHFNKGCYLGQEIVERIRSRGNVHRTFTAYRLEGSIPPAGTVIEAEAKSVGEITSAAAIPLSSGTLHLALGYIRREALDRAVPLTYAGGEAHPVPLPIRDL
ncbi:YgfZ/GcvT domain-containing protein [Granulicella arctica]|uniref:Folate-binding protein YgfZ n=1 Tax=Granulicella arctica TaxID=940613 RepID=A0A7Y9PKD4_9BACT|nr:folate-binding protein YgfZ [Granulicella arctica]NYF81344.1 folate-binding protein YgfZ [Granulicella arctica]